MRTTSAMSAPWRWSSRPTYTRRPEDVPPGVVTLVVMAASRLVSLEPEGGGDDHALDHLGDLFGDAGHDGRVLQQLEHHRTHHGAPDGRLAAGQRGPGDGH